ncbi:PLDc N-terminal domain-containing protein [Methanosarcina hadiensis]|uniref:PLDc N-terminal domain-containing protein n=1 Tax=Methanosarcina hadiensis TaxID=3078083 RepID=UPI003977BE1C
MSLITNIWGLIALASVIWVIYDVMTQNKGLSDVKKIIWIVVALLFGILGAVLYYFLGRKK